MSDRSELPRLPAKTPDLALLRRFEPVVRFTQGERFYPSDVGRYLAECGLWVHYPDGHDAALLPEGAVDEAALVAPRDLPFGTVLYLKLVGELNLAESAQALREAHKAPQDPEQRFRGGVGRLARVGYLSRIVDALFSISLLLRGRVPAATAAVAGLAYQQLQERDERYVYYGRVVREGGWVALQYWFFYFYNSWRSGFNGVNDHEADWEQVIVYLYQDDDGQLVPRWAAFASHDFHGGDLRRRWDDAEELELVEGHPVVYAGAGSHASYFRPGEYLTNVRLPLPEPVHRVARAVHEFWTRTLRQAARSDHQDSPFCIPFVDYARGDGIAIGPGQERGWSPEILAPVPAWASGYRGLWGLYARDPISGENAPAGPMYNRDGSPRAAWFDPLGFAALDKAPPRPVERRLLATRQADLQARQAAIEAELERDLPTFQALSVERRALAFQPHLARQYEALTGHMKHSGEAITALRREHAENDLLLESVALRLSRLAAGEEDPPQAHLRHLARPASAQELRFHRLAEVWAAVSIGLLLLGGVLVFVFVPNRLLLALAAMVLGLLLIDAALRGTFESTVTSISVVLAVVALLILFLHFWWQVLLITALAAGAFLLLENLRELRA